MKKLLDTKTIFIIILGALLVIMILARRSNNPTDYENEIKALHEQNDKLTLKNDSLKTANEKLDVYIKQINTQLVINQKLLNNTQSQLDNLNKRRNEIPNNVKRLSANGVASEFSKYLDKRTKSTSVR